MQAMWKIWNNYAVNGFISYMCGQVESPQHYTARIENMIINQPPRLCLDTVFCDRFMYTCFSPAGSHASLKMILFIFAGEGYTLQVTASFSVARNGNFLLRVPTIAQRKRNYLVRARKEMQTAGRFEKRAPYRGHRTGYKHYWSSLYVATYLLADFYVHSVDINMSKEELSCSGKTVKADNMNVSKL